MATVIVVVMTMARTMNMNVSMIRILSMIIVMLVISLRVHFQASSYTLMLGNPHPPATSCTSRHFMHRVYANLMTEKARCFGKLFGCCQDASCV